MFSNTLFAGVSTTQPLQRGSPVICWFCFGRYVRTADPPTANTMDLDKYPDQTLDFQSGTHVSHVGMKTGQEDRNFLKVVAKTFRVIDVIAQHPEGIQLGELARQCDGQPKATVFRILHTLRELGYVQQEEKSAAYQLTHQIAWLGRSETRETLKRAVRPYLERLRAQFEQTVALAVLDRDQLLYIEILDGLRSIRMNATVNTYAPLHCTSLGKAILSRLFPEELARILSLRPLAKLTPKTITSIAQLERHLAEVRSQGYAVDNEETEEGARCVGAAICGYQGRPVAAISVSGPLSFLPSERIPEVAREVKKAARSVPEWIGASENGAQAPKRAPARRR